MRKTRVRVKGPGVRDEEKMGLGLQDYGFSNTQYPNTQLPIPD